MPSELLDVIGHDTGSEDRTRRAWDAFWRDRASRRMVIGDELEHWQDLVWRVTSDFWLEVFHELAPGKKMLECGCGSARFSQYMTRHGYDCTVLDYSEEGVMFAGANFAAVGLGGQFVVGDMNQLCWRDGTFDIVFSGGVLQHLRDFHLPVREMVRVLRPGGLFAANVVPDKFSCQTLADIERTVAHSLRSLAKGRFGDVFKRVTYRPPFYMSRARLREYVSACEAAGLTNVVGLGTSPFPNLSLPAAGQRLYARMMKRLLPQWRQFDRSRARWTEIWGATYTIYGVKRE